MTMPPALALLAVLVMGSAYAQDPPQLFRYLQCAYALEAGIDYGLTYAAVTKYGYRELNPAAQWVAARPAVGIAIETVVALGFVGLTSWAYKQNKTVAWGLVVAAVVIKGAVLYRNFRAFDKN